MEVIVVERNYSYWEDSYTKVLGVCMTEDKADELIEIDKHKDDHPKMNKESWLACEQRFYEERKALIHNESCNKKKGGFLKRFHYDGLNKVAKHAYDELLKKYDGMTFDDEVWNKMNDLDTFYFNQIINKDLTKLTFEEYNELDDWYSEHDHHEDPEHIYYHKTKFEVI